MLLATWSAFAKLLCPETQLAWGHSSKGGRLLKTLVPVPTRRQHNPGLTVLAVALEAK